VRVQLVTREGCPLCDEALEALADAGVEVAIHDVDADDELHRLYDFRVPVVLHDGRVLLEGKISAADVRRIFGRVG
jgi:glutaredoxin